MRIFAHRFKIAILDGFSCAHHPVSINKLCACSVIRADADFQPFPNGVFDGVFALTLLQNMPDPLLTLHEMKRVSKSSSTIVITGFKKFQIYRYFYQSIFSRLLKEAGLNVSIIIRNGQLKDHVADVGLRFFSRSHRKRWKDQGVSAYLVAC